MDPKKLYPALFKMTEKSGIFSGILHENSLVVATNRIVLAEVRFDYAADHEGKVLNKEGVDLKIEHGNFPKYRNVIPELSSMQKYDGQISLKELRFACKNIVRAKITDKLNVLQIGLKYYDPKELLMLLDIYELLGEVPAIYQQDGKRSTTFISKNCTGLCFELLLTDDSDNREVFNISQALSYSKPVTNATKKAFYE